MARPALRILVADDDPTMGLLMRAALGGEAFALTVVDNGRVALDEFGRQTFDMVLLDVEMPEMDGMAVCAAIRRSDRPATPVVLVTGRDDPAFALQVRALSAELIVKPINWAALPATLLSLLG